MDFIRIAIITQACYWIGYLIGKYKERDRIRDLVGKLEKTT